MARNAPNNAGPHIGQIAYQRQDMPPTTQTKLIEGGGCPDSYDVLLPDLPFDFLQPDTKQQVTQLGYGGRYVIRGNPIGAIFDAIKGFCNPAPMTYDGNTFSDMSGNNAGSYGDYTSPYLGDSGYPYAGPFGNGNYNPSGSQSCGKGTMWDNVNMVCVPTTDTPPTMTPPAMTYPNQCDDPAYFNMMAMQEGAAYAMGDVSTLCGLQGMINVCPTSASTPGMKVQWAGLAAKVKAHIIALGCSDCASCKQNKPVAKTAADGMDPNAASSPMPPMPSGTNNVDGGGMTGNGMGGMVMGMTTPDPLGYIDASHPVGKTNVVKALSKAFQHPPLPDMPNPMSLTEGNIGLMPSAEPMGGMFDPSAAVNTRAAPRGRNYGSQQTQRTVNQLRGRGQL